VDGGLVISLPPAAFPGVAHSAPCADRLDDLFFWTEAGENLYPVYWVDPLEDDALEQIEKAIERGIMGFKVICDRFYPADERAIEAFKYIAQQEKPILFHSGILWDGKPSSTYNRPLSFEALLEVDRLKFSLAHVAWPWCDELIAVYGKFLNAFSSRPDLSVEMFIDISPGTPAIYRQEVLTKLFTVGYDVQHNIIFGSDSEVNDYNIAWTRQWIDRDDSIYQQIGLKRNVLQGIYRENLRRFLGLSSTKVEHKLLEPGR
jgi:predicted TIM-barrel fold metal-dependent hydrolase